MFVCAGSNCTVEVTGPNELCERDWDARTVYRGAILPLWVRAHAYLPPSSPAIRPDIVGAPTLNTLSPLRIAVYDAIETTLCGMLSWALIARERETLPPLPGLGETRSGWLLDRCMDTLTLYDEALRDGYGAAYYRSLGQCYRRLGNLTDRGDGDFVRVMTPCATPDCGYLTLVRNTREGYTACLTCGARWSDAAWQMIAAAGPQAVYAEDGNRPQVGPVLPPPVAVGRATPIHDEVARERPRRTRLALPGRSRKG